MVIGVEGGLKNIREGVSAKDRVQAIRASVRYRQVRILRRQDIGVG
jgi:hypothetical protein